MERTVWVCLLCLQTALLSHALDCSSQTTGCAGGQLSPRVPADNVKRRWQISRPGSGALIGSARPTGDQQQEQAVVSRQRRQLQRSGPTHFTQSSLPGSIHVKGFPNKLIQAERPRRHLGHSGTKKKKKLKSRPGSVSLLVAHNPISPLQVMKVKRQVQDPAKKGKSGRSGAYSVLGDGGSEPRPKRSIQ